MVEVFIRLCKGYKHCITLYPTYYIICMEHLCLITTFCASLCVYKLSVNKYLKCLAFRHLTITQTSPEIAIDISHFAVRCIFDT